MHKQNEIKVFHKGSTKVDMVIRHPLPGPVARKADELIGEGLGGIVEDAFATLKRIGADSLSLRHKGRKIKVELAHAA